MAWAVLPSVVALSGLPVIAQGAGPAQIRFTYENPKLQPPKYVVTVGEDGTGHFRSEGGGPASNDPQNMPADPQDRPIHISKALREAMFATARKNKLFAMACDDGAKNIAFQGTKTLQYEGPEGQGSCTYNWSKSAQIDKLTDQFEAVACNPGRRQQVAASSMSMGASAWIRNWNFWSRWCTRGGRLKWRISPRFCRRLPGTRRCYSGCSGARELCWRRQDRRRLIHESRPAASKR